jgi:hypothetical protein
MKFIWSLALVVSLLVPCALIAQSTDASLTGLIDDPQKKVIPEVSVTAINTQTGVKTSTTTNNDGQYVLEGLIPGSYRIEVDKQGFKGIIEAGLTLHVQDIVQINFHMAVGSMSETLTVNASGVNVDTTDGTVSTVIDRALIDNMPLNGKDMQTLFELSPGTILNAGGNASNGGGFSVDGQRPTSNYLTIDGASGNAYVAGQAYGVNVMGSTIATSASGGTNGILPIDAIEEYRMDTSTYTAENGRTPGGQIQVRTRSGTNEFHGTLFENFRNQVLDAEDWFVKYDNIKQSQLRMNDFGGTVGGPVIVPRIFDGRNRLFFFVAHDTLDLDQPNTTSEGDVPSQSTRQSAASVFQPFMPVFPLGNGGPDPSNPGFDFYSASYPFQIRNHTTSARVDYQLPHSIHTYIRANIAPSSSELPAINGAGVEQDIYTYTGGVTAPITPRLVNDFTINRTSNGANNLYIIGSTGGNDPNALRNNLPTGVIPSTYQFSFYMNPNSTTSAAVGPNQVNTLTQWNTIDSLTRQLGKHTLKFGADLLTKTITLDAPSTAASFALLTGQSNSTTNFQNGIVDWLFYFTDVADPVISLKNLSLFVNDSWHFSPSVVLNAGLRWEFNPAASIGPLGVLALQGSDLNPATINASISDHPLYKNVYDNFAPRFGFAWTIPGNVKYTTVLRGGAGTYFDTGQASTAAMAATSSYPYVNIGPFLLNLPYQSINWSGLANNTTPEETLPLSSANFVDPNLLSPRTYEWSLTIEQSFGTSARVSASYIGNDGEKLVGQTEYFNAKNSQGSYPVNTSLISPNGYLTIAMNATHSNYQALQVQFTGRMARQLDSLFSYTWEHAEDNGSTDFTSTGYAVNNRIANSGIDIPQQFSGAIHYSPTGFTGDWIGRAFTRGWIFDTICRLQSSPPYTVTVYVPNPNVNAFRGNADVVPGQPVVLHEKYDNFGKIVPGGRLFNYAAFASPPTDPSGNLLRQGDSPTNAYRLFGLTQWDIAATHTWRIVESVNLDFRVDAFNILNLVNFGPPETGWSQYSASTFGRASSTYAENFGSQPYQLGQSGTQLAVFQNGGARSLQLSMKVKF